MALTTLLVEPPGGPITRDGAREDAGREVSKEIYHRDDPGLVEQVYDKAVDWLDRLFGRAAEVAPGGGPGVLAILLLLAALVAVVLWWTGPVRRAGRGAVLDPDALVELSADDHRRLADGHAAAGRHREAVRERMRAIARELESRGVLEPRPGRTADEVARDAGTQVPALAEGLRHAARTFDEVWYGGHRAGPGADADMRRVDEQVRGTSLRPTGGPR